MLVGNKCMHNKKSWLTTGAIAIVQRIGHLTPRFYPHKWSLDNTWSDTWAEPGVSLNHHHHHVYTLLPPKYSLDIIKTTTFTQKRHYKENKRIGHLQGENVCKSHMWPSLGATPSYAHGGDKKMIHRGAQRTVWCHNLKRAPSIQSMYTRSLSYCLNPRQRTFIQDISFLMFHKKKKKPTFFK